MVSIKSISFDYLRFLLLSLITETTLLLYLLLLLAILLYHLHIFIIFALIHLLNIVHIINPLLHLTLYLFLPFFWLSFTFQCFLLSFGLKGFANLFRFLFKIFLFLLVVNCDWNINLDSYQIVQLLIRYYLSCISHLLYQFLILYYLLFIVFYLNHKLIICLKRQGCLTNMNCLETFLCFLYRFFYTFSFQCFLQLHSYLPQSPFLHLLHLLYFLLVVFYCSFKLGLLLVYFLDQKSLILFPLINPFLKILDLLMMLLDLIKTSGKLFLQYFNSLISLMNIFNQTLMLFLQNFQWLFGFLRDSLRTYRFQTILVGLHILFSHHLCHLFTVITHCDLGLCLQTGDHIIDQVINYLSRIFELQKVFLLSGLVIEIVLFSLRREVIQCLAKNNLGFSILSVHHYIFVSQDLLLIQNYIDVLNQVIQLLTHEV